jgi:hypothetical protein
LTLGTVDDKGYGLDRQLRILELRSFTCKVIGEQERVLVYTGEDPEFQMHNLDVEAAAALRLFNDLVNHADCNREFVHALPSDIGSPTQPASCAEMGYIILILMYLRMSGAMVIAKAIANMPSAPKNIFEVIT